MEYMFRNLIQRIKKARKESDLLKGGLFGFFYSYILSLLIEKGFSKEIIRNTNILQRLDNPVAAHNLARANFLNGKYESVVLILQVQDQKKRCHADGYYLLSEAYRLLEQKEIARDVLIKTLSVSNRLKTWLYLANLVDSKEEFDDLLKLWRFYVNKKVIPSYHYEVNGYIATAALRAQQYQYALNIWENFINNLHHDDCIFPVKNKKVFQLDAATTALKDLRNTLIKNDVDFFLISGTLLGCIRNNYLLGHDKDIDVGIWEDCERSKIINAISTSGFFEFHAIRSEHVIRIKHVNGVSIDIFYHYREENNYWHGGVKLRWNNTPFILKEHKFLGVKFNIPSNYELYLTENYGDWRMENKEFDSAFDTPNGVNINNNELIVHIYKCLAVALKKHDTTRIKMLEKKLSNLNSKEIDF